MPEKRLTPDQTALEAALASLKPANPSWNRDHVMYSAGRQAATTESTRTNRSRYTIAIVLVIGSLSLNCLLAMRSTSPIIVHNSTGDTEADLVSERKEGETLPSERIRKQRFGNPPASYRYIQLRQLALSRGIENLPDLNTHSTPGQSRTPSSSGNRQLLNELLGT